MTGGSNTKKTSQRYYVQEEGLGYVKAFIIVFQKKVKRETVHEKAVE